jgi:transitional endoplasmic reticulum ATPase
MSTKSATAVDPDKLVYSNMTVERSGKKIILPEDMSYKEGRTWLTRQEEAEDKTVAIRADIPCFPLDGLVALAKAIQQMYGFTNLASTPGFWGDSPPLLVQIETPKGIVTAPVGRLQPPKFEGGFLDTSPGKMSLIIGGEVRKKYESEVKQIIEKTKEVLANDSIYRGQAIILDLEYLNNDENFHPVNHAPKFMDVKDVNENGVLLNASVLFPIAANIYTRIERTADCEQNGIPVRHGAVFAGKYGTGKTLTSGIIASKCVRNNWTFIYLKTANQIAVALKLAEMYGPAVLFVEDIDLVTSGERDADMNTILNTMDGVDTKGKPIITILTTNHVEKIEKAMMRPGRIDTLVHFTYPDAPTAFKFVEMYAKDDDGKSLLAEMTDAEKKQVGESLAGMIPAFIAEAVHKSKCYAIGAHGKDIAGKVTGEAIVNAAESQKEQVRLLEGQKNMTLEEKTHAAVRHIGQVHAVNRQHLPDTAVAAV